MLLPLLLLLTALFAVVGGGAVVTLNITLPYLFLPCHPVKPPRLPSLLSCPALSELFAQLGSMSDATQSPRLLS